MNRVFIELGRGGRRMVPSQRHSLGHVYAVGWAGGGTDKLEALLHCQRAV